MAREATIDLQAQIDCLRSVKSDLEAYFWEHQTRDALRQDEREEVAFWIRLVADRTLALESLLLQKGASRVVIRGLDAAGQAQITEATRIIDRWIPEDEPFESARSAVAMLLAAADIVGLRAVTGAPADNIRPA